MMRIHFTADDLVRSRIASAPDPMWEAVLSLTELRGSDNPIVFGRWRREARGRVDSSVRYLLPLVPPIGYFADFLTPAEGLDGIDAGIDAFLHTPRHQLRADVATLAANRTLPGWLRNVAAGDPTTLVQIGAALRSYHDTILRPYWPTILAHVEADRARGAQAFLDGGWLATLAALSDSIRWRPPVLEVNYSVDRDLFLHGRGLLLIPSYFCWRLPISLMDQERRPVLVYPVRRDPLGPTIAGSSHHPDDQSLATLLGHTRAAILRALDVSRTTSGLSRHVGVSVASASQHATVLRNAGLITTHRQGSSVLHSLTPLGMSLLHRQRSSDNRADRGRSIAPSC